MPQFNLEQLIYISTLDYISAYACISTKKMPFICRKLANFCNL